MECFIVVAAISQIEFWEPLMTNSNKSKERHKKFHEFRNWPTLIGPGGIVYIAGYFSVQPLISTS